MYMFQKLFINTLVESPKCRDYPDVISGYLGKNWGILLGVLYFLMLVIWVLVYSTAITNDSASFLQSFGLTKQLLSDNPFYGLALVCILVSLASRGEALLFKVSSFMVLTKLSVIAILGFMMIEQWDLNNIGAVPTPQSGFKDTIVMLPFTLSSILFVTNLSPLVISYRAREKSIEVARYKAQRAMKLAFGILFVVVFFYAVSFSLAMGHDQALKAYDENISALAMVAQGIPGDTIKLFSLILNIFAVMTAFFAVYMGFREACYGLTMNLLRRTTAEEKINTKYVNRGIILFTILLAWGAICFNAPVLSFTSISSPIFGLVGCLIPAYLVYRVPALHKYKGLSLYIVIATGILLCLSPLLTFS